MNMFSNVNVFKETFKRRLAEKYSTSIELSHITEQFDILGEMVRDYANYDWRAVRTEVKEEDKKQLIYFSMEFLMGRLLSNNLQNLGIYDIAKKGLEELGIDIMSINLLLPDETDPVVWRGPVIGGVVKQFWTDVIWKDVDYLFVDMPPGTGDVPLTVYQSITCVRHMQL